MRKLKFIFPILVLLIVLLIVLCNICFISNSKLEDFQTNVFDLKYIHFGNYYFSENSSVDLSGMLQKEGKSLQQVYTQVGETLYFSYQYEENSNVHWCIATIKNGDYKINVVCDEVFGVEGLSKFKINLSDNYEERNGYCYNNKIVLTDFSKLVEYNIESNKKVVYDYSDYKHPAENFYCNIENYNKIVVTQNNKTYVLTVSDLVEKNSVAKTVFDKYNNQTINGTRACEYFFDNIQFINGNIYIVCRVHRWDGCAYALVFSYDLQTENIEYLGGHYTNDLVRQFYLVDYNQGDGSMIDMENE